MDEDLFNEIIKEQKEEVDEWKKKLKKNLSTHSYQREEIVLISRFWFDNYEQYFLNKNNGEEFNEEEIYNIIKEKNQQIFIKFFGENINIEEIPILFPLDKNTWTNIKKYIDELYTMTNTGFFGNEILIINISESVYCLFFDDKGKIKQGILQIINKNNENNIINYFYQNGLGNYKNTKNFGDKDNYLIIILDQENVSKIDNNQIKNRKRDRAHTVLTPNARGKIKADEIKCCIGNKIINIPKNYKIDVVKEMGKSKNLFNKILQEAKINKELLTKEKENNIKDIEKKDNNNEQKKEKKKRKLIDFSGIKHFFPSKPVKKLSTPGIIGLENIGATCYMNATLQCFSNIEKLRTYLIDKKYQELEKNKNEKKLSFALAEVLNHLWNDLNIQYYKPEYFKKIISEMNPLFKGIAANDPKDLVLFILETLHKELNKAPNIKMDNNYSANNQDFFEVFNEFFEFFKNENKSIISDQFYGSINSMTICGFCKVAVHNVQTINILFFPLEEIRIFKNYSNNNYVQIEDCFEYYERQEIYPSCYCNNCRQLYPAYNQSKIIYTPPTLIMNLNRGKGLQFNVNIQLKEIIDLRNYIFYSESPYKYELVGVICHYGTNDMGGHFIAYCKNSNNSQWYKYNDAIVTKISFTEITGLPYVLFYSYILE